MKGVNGRLATLMLALMLAVSAAGCGSGGFKDGTAAGSSSSGAAPEKAPVTLKMYIPAGGSSPIVSGIQDDPVAKEIEKATGVTMDVEASGSEDKIKVMVASGDLPDLTVINDPAYIEPLIKAGSIMALDRYVTNAPSIQKNAAMAIDYCKDVFSGGSGKLYVLPARAKQKPSPVATSYEGLFLRWDYYKELGTPEIKDAAGLVSIVTQMVKKHPVNQDGKKNYGFQTWVDWGLIGYCWNSFYSKYSGYTDIGSYEYYNLKTYEFVSLLDDRNRYWKTADLFNKAYRAGILDPESFTQKYETAQQKVDDGRILCAFQEWLIATVNASLAKSTNGVAAYVDIPMPDTEEYAAWYDRSAPLGYTERMFIVSSKCKTPERVVDLLDYLYSEEGSRTVFSGLKGVDWVEENGKARLTDECINSVKTDPDYKTREGIHKYEGIVGLDYDALAENGQFLDLFLEPELTSAVYTTAEKEYCMHYGVDNKLAVIGKRQYKTTINNGIASLMPILTPDLTRTSTKIENYLTQEMPNLITAKDDAAFNDQKDRMFMEIEKMGYEALRAFDEDGFKKAIEKIKQYQ